MRLLLVFALLASLAIAPAHGQIPSPDFPHVVVSGDAKILVAPDIATIEFEILAFEQSSSSALEQMQSQVLLALEVLRSEGVPAEAITAYAIEKKVERARQGGNQLDILGYFVSRHFSVDLDDLSSFNELITALMQIDNLTMEYASFDVSDRQAIKSKLTSQAAESARVNAEIMAGGVGARVQSVFSVYVDESRSGSGVFHLFGGGGPAGAPATIFKPATIEISESLRVIFRIDN